MEMILRLTSLRDETIDRLLGDPPLVWAVVAPDEPERYLQARCGVDGAGFLSRFRTHADATATLEPLSVPIALAPDEGPIATLDEAWHGIHFLLTDSDWDGPEPLNFLTVGGRRVGRVRVGFGPARVFSARQVRRIASALDEVSDGDLRRRYSPEDMVARDIHPGIWTRDRGDALDYLIRYVGVLRTALAAAVVRGHGLMLTLH